MIVRRVILGWAIWMSTWITIEVFEYAKTFGTTIDINLAAVVGAILTPVLGLTGYIIRQYASNPYGDKLSEDKSEPKDR